MLYLTLQDIFDLMYKGRSAGEVGTLFQIRNSFNHRNVTSNVMAGGFNHHDDLINFTTTCLSTVLAMKLAGMEDLDSVPDLCEPDVAPSVAQVTKLAQRLVSHVWLAPPQGDIVDVVDAVVTAAEINEYLDSSDEASSTDDEDEYNHHERAWCVCGRRK